MIINQNIKAILRTFPNLQKNLWETLNHRSSHLRCSIKKGVLKNFVICKIFKKIFFIQHLRMTASDVKQTSTAATTEFLSKIPNRKKISNEHFNLCEAEISLDVS